MGDISQHFSNGWYDGYPRFHFYMLAAMSPALVLNALGRISVDDVGTYPLVVIGLCRRDTSGGRQLR